MPDTSLAVVITLLETISAQLDALPRALVAAQRERGSALSKTDREALEVLLPAIADAVGNLHFTSRELIAHGEADSILLAALVRVYGSITTGTARRLGRLLNRADGFAMDDLRVQRVGYVRDGALWSIARV
ncbi:MAG: hypothetical protein WKH97_02365 [Casimicrobiaceae bacterium]